MKITAIITEYNPLHNGHLYQLLTAREETNPDALVIVMSGSFTQRGDITVADKYTRADWAIKAGADLVLELPTAFSLSHAPRFALGAVKTLMPLGEITLSFGSESGDIRTLEEAASTLKDETEEFKQRLNEYMSQGYSLAKSRTLALDIENPDLSRLISTPNNILGVEYIKAAKFLRADFKFHTVKRRYSDNGGAFLSSGEVRKLMEKGEDYSKAVPPFVRPTQPDLKRFEAICLYAIASMTEEQLAGIANISEGFENRLKKTNFKSMDEICALVTKRYTRATVKRIVASAALGVKKNMFAKTLKEKYFRVLAVRDSRKDLLSYLAKRCDNVFIKASDCPLSSPIRPLIDLDEKAHKFYTIVSNQKNVPNEPLFLKNRF